MEFVEFMELGKRLTVPMLFTIIGVRTMWMLWKSVEWPVRKRIVSLVVTIGLVVLMNEVIRYG